MWAEDDEIRRWPRKNGAAAQRETQPCGSGLRHLPPPQDHEGALESCPFHWRENHEATSPRVYLVVPGHAVLTQNPAHPKGRGLRRVKYCQGIRIGQEFCTKSPRREALQNHCGV